MIFNIDTFYDGGTDRINFYDQGLNFLDVFNAMRPLELCKRKSKK